MTWRCLHTLFGTPACLQGQLTTCGVHRQASLPGHPALSEGARDDLRRPSYPEWSGSDGFSRFPDWIIEPGQSFAPTIFPSGNLKFKFRLIQLLAIDLIGRASRETTSRASEAEKRGAYVLPFYGQLLIPVTRGSQGAARSTDATAHQRTCANITAG
jgi:hypothetical protein